MTATTANETPALLSVVIPTVGRRDLLDEQLASLSACEWEHPWEVLIADNGSRDGTRELVSRWSVRLPGLRWVDASARRGRSFAVNEGARKASGRFLLLVDDDDLVDPEIISAVGDGLLGGAEAVVFNFDVRSLNRPAIWQSLHHDELEHGVPSFMGLPAIWGNFAIDRELFLRLGGFDEDLLYAEDLEFSVRLHQEGGVVPRHLPRRLVHYRLRGTPRERFRQSVSYGVASAQIAARYPELTTVVAPKGHGRWRVLVSAALALVRMSPRVTSERGRFELAAYAGRQWGRFKAAGM